MEIKTSQSPREIENPDVNLALDRSMHLRRKPTQQIRKSHAAGRFLANTLRILGQLGVLALVVLFILSVLIYAITSDQFTLRTVTLYGCKHLDAQNLEAMIRKDFPSQILRIDLKKLRSRIEQQTWAKRAEIRRILPSELVIYVQERTPSVILEIRGELMLADDEGVLLDKYGTKYGKLDVPVFKGFLGDNAESYRLYQEENTERVRLGLRMLVDLESGSAAFTRNISEVDLSDKSNVRLILVDDTAEISLGDRDFLKRFRTLMSNLGKYQELKAQYNDIASVDLRFDGQIIYRPRRESAARTSVPVEARQ